MLTTTSHAPDLFASALSDAPLAARVIARRLDPVPDPHALFVALADRRLCVRSVAGTGVRRAYRLEWTDAALAPLTARERDALRLVGLGLANKEIAYELGVSISTGARALASSGAALGLPGRVDLALVSAALQGRCGPGVARIESAGDALVLVIALGASPLWSRLSPAERVVAELALAGHGGAAIARERGQRSPRTIANQLGRIFRKVGVSHRAELATRLVAGV